MLRGHRVYIQSTGRDPATGLQWPLARSYATVVTGLVHVRRYEGVGEPEPHLLLDFDGVRLWEPMRKIKIDETR